MRCIHGLSQDCNKCSKENGKDMKEDEMHAMSFNWFREKIENLQEKIYRLEHEKKYFDEKISHVQDGIELCLEKIGCLEKWKEIAIEKNVLDIQRIIEIEKRLETYKKIIWQHDLSIGNHAECIQAIEENDSRAGKKPHECNACEGSGLVWE